MFGAAFTRRESVFSPLWVLGSVRYAKNYISGALAAMLDLGKGSGPMNHAFAIEGEFINE